MPVDGMCCSRFRFYGNLLGYSINNIRSEKKKKKKTLVISLIHDIYFPLIFQNFQILYPRSFSFHDPPIILKKRKKERKTSIDVWFSRVARFQKSCTISKNSRNIKYKRDVRRVTRNSFVACLFDRLILYSDDPFLMYKHVV